MMHDDFIEFLMEKEKKKDTRPEILPEIVSHYERDSSRIPDQIRVSFSDGSTAVYEIKVEQPAPQFLESIRIIRKWKQGYVNQPARRRRNRR